MSLMKIIILICLLLVVSLLSITCKDEVSAVEDRTEPGRRDYVWTVDTFRTDDPIGITDIWGDNPKLIYITASGNQKYGLWNYNGSSWKVSDQKLNNGLFTIFGLNSNEIWIGDSQKHFWKKVGNKWEIFKTIEIAGFRTVAITSIYGNSNENVHAVGFSQNDDGECFGFIYKYINGDWLKLDIPQMKIRLYDIKPMQDGRYVVTGLDADENKWLEKVYIWDGAKYFKEIYSGSKWPSIHMMNKEVYITIRSSIFKIKNDEMVLWKSFPNSSFYGGLIGRNEKDFFGGGYDGVFHFNGTDFIVIYPAKLNIAPGIIFEKEVFFIAWDEQKQLNLVIKGTLK